MRELSERRYVVQGTSSLLIRIEDTLKTFTAGHDNCRLKLKFQDGRGSEQLRQRKLEAETQTWLEPAFKGLE